MRLSPLAASLTLALSSMTGIAAAVPSSAAAAPAPAGTAGPVLGRHTVHPALSNGAAGLGTATSKNWSGYVVTNAGGGTDFTTVSSRWTEPAVRCGSQESWAGFWVGLDGWTSDSVEQGGTEAHCVNGTPHYNVWWEMWPSNNVQTSFSIRPGDSIQASVTYSSGNRVFAIVVEDLTNGETLSRNQLCASDQHGCVRSAAEVVSEDVGGGNDTDGLYYLPDYGTVSYTGSSVTDVNGHSGTLNDSAWQTTKVNEVSSGGLTKQTTSALSSDGTGFATTWVNQ